MKKIFSMMLLAVAMITVFTGCSKSDDNSGQSPADALTGVYSGTMTYWYNNTSIGKKEVSVKVFAESSNKVSFVIPEIKDLSFNVPMGGRTMSITVKKYAEYTVSGVPVLEYRGAVVASKFTSVKQLEELPLEMQLTFPEYMATYGQEYRDVDVSGYEMVFDGVSKPGKGKVSGAVTMTKNGSVRSVMYSFRPVQNIEGIEIIGELTLY